MFALRLYDRDAAQAEVLLEEHEYASEEQAREITRACMRDGYSRVTLTKPDGYHRFLTDDEQTRLYMVPWPHRLEVARQIDAEHQEAAAQARQAELDAKHADWMAWVAWTHRKAEEEARKHRAGQPCDARYCDECARLVNLA